MTRLELLAPARNADIGIAAVDCGADAVYIGAPEFGARKDAGNSVEDIARLCEYAHKFGVRIFVTFNVEIRSGEWDAVHDLMLRCRDAGADAFIIREPRLMQWDDVGVEMHASTQCAIRTPERARELEALGMRRIVLERQLSLDEIKSVRDAVGCELECFVHGALCVGYSGECRLSEYLDGRSADRGECVQACRSLYDLVDSGGTVLVRSKALLSLRDLNLLDRVSDLADAGVCSFKIEGRLKNESYVRNVVSAYSVALDALVASRPGEYCRASFGSVSAGFEPDLAKTFNRGYTSLLLDGKRGKWSSMDAPKSMGEAVGRIKSVRSAGKGCLELLLKPFSPELRLRSGDGFAFVKGSSIVGFRGDVCEGLSIRCKSISGLKEGVLLYRNSSAEFEKTLSSAVSRRELRVDVDVEISGRFKIVLKAFCEDGRQFESVFNADVEAAENADRASVMLRDQLSKRAGIYNFKVRSLDCSGALPLLSASTINGMRRLLSEDLDTVPTVGARAVAGADSVGSDLAGNLVRGASGCDPSSDPGTAAREKEPEVLLRSKYCVRYELGMCPKFQGAAPSGPLFLVNNGRRLSLRFDCAACEMTVAMDTITMN